MTNIPPTKLKPWKVLESKDISNNKFAPVFKDTVELASGKNVDYYIVKIRPAVMIFPFTKSGDLVLVRQYKHGAGEIIIEGPAGMVEEGQTLEDAAVAELEQETGIKYKKEKLISLGKHIQSPSKNTHLLYGYLALDAEFNSKQNLDEIEDIEILTVKPNEAVEMIKSGEIWASDTVAFILKIKLQHPELFN